MPRVWVPYAEFVTDIESVGDDVHAHVFTGENSPPESIDEVAFYVAPYSFVGIGVMDAWLRRAIRWSSSVCGARRE